MEVQAKPITTPGAQEGWQCSVTGAHDEQNVATDSVKHRCGKGKTGDSEEVCIRVVFEAQDILGRLLGPDWSIFMPSVFKTTSVPLPLTHDWRRKRHSCNVERLGV